MKQRIFVTISIVVNIVLITYLITTTHSTNTSGTPQEEMIEEKSTSTEIRIVMLGNSITHAGDWEKVLERSDVFNGGKPGWTTQQLSWVIKDFITPYRPKLCFFKAGINDYTLGITTARIYQNICENLDTIKKIGTYPVYTTTLYQRGNTYRNRQIDSLNDKMIAYCNIKGYDVVDLRPYLCADGDILKKYVQDDNTHLKPEAYPEWAKALKPILDKYGI